MSPPEDEASPSLALGETRTAGPEDTPPRRPLSDASLPPSIGRFAIEARLGAGGMGTVLLATDPLLERKVALKVLHREDRAQARLRFLREAQAMARVAHENIIVVHEVGTDHDQVFIAMELVTGGTLRQWQAGRAWRDVVGAYVQAGRGLQAAHAAGLVHRDFKPDNVLVGRDGKVRVTDFGLVAAVDDTAGASRLDHTAALGVSLTQTGSVLGTPRYMAPEQHLGEPVDARADQFAFCVALYEALYGQPPFAGDTYAALTEQVLAGAVRPPQPDVSVPASVYEVIARGLERDRGDRFPSMTELLATLETARATPPTRAAARPRWRTLMILAAAAALVVVVVLVSVLAVAARRDADAQRRRAAELDRAMEQLKGSNDFGAAATRFEAAQEAYAERRYDESALMFLDAYASTRAAPLLYNVAASFQQKGKTSGDAGAYRQAVVYYRRYLTEATDAPDRTKVEKMIHHIEAEAKRIEGLAPDAGVR